MANITKLSMTFVDGTTVINAEKMNGIVNKINEIIDNMGGDTPTQTVATPSITINNGVVTITCATSGATIRYTTNGSTPTSSSGTVYSAAFTPASGTTQIKAIAYKSGMTDSSVTTKNYSSTSPEAAAVLAKFSNLSSAQSTKVENFVDSLVSAGIYNKIHYLSIPVVASTAAEAFQNVLNSVTPPTVETAVVSGGVKTSELVNLTSLVSSGMDYDDFTLAYGIELDSSQEGNTPAILRLNTEASSTASRIYETTSTSQVTYKGTTTNGHLLSSGEETSSMNIVSHDKTNSVEKWFNRNSGELTSGEDGAETPTNNGLSINTSSTSTTYNCKFTGKYKFMLLAELLTDAQMTTLKSAMETLLS